MFVFASALLVVAAGCAFALPKDKADSRRRRQESYSDDDESAPFVDATAPVFDSSIRESLKTNSSGSYGGTETL